VRDGCDRRDVRAASTFVVVAPADVTAADAPLVAGYGVGDDAPAPAAVPQRPCAVPSAR
jgi:hypothetical protein